MYLRTSRAFPSQSRVIEILRRARGLIQLLWDVRRLLQNDHLASLGILRFRVTGQQSLLHGIITVTYLVAPAALPGPWSTAVGVSWITRQNLWKWWRKFFVRYIFLSIWFRSIEISIFNKYVHHAFFLKHMICYYRFCRVESKLMLLFQSTA